jgi:transcriptional regulator with XRE-family HTH domain
MDEISFGARIKARREELGISQKEVAAALDIDQGKVSLIEKGQRRVVAKELAILSKLLQVQVSWFFVDMGLSQDTSPVNALLNQYFPDSKFTSADRDRIGRFLEITLVGYVQTDPNLSQKARTGKSEPPIQQEKTVTHPDTYRTSGRKRRVHTEF